MDEWKIKICAEPSQITGTKLPACEMIMGKTEFEVENCQDIDRKIQAEMLTQVPLERWGVFFCE